MKDSLEYFQSVLGKISKRHTNSEISALVGAGFSKNVDEKFPLWKELLTDMVEELYENEITIGFKNEIHQNKKKKHCYEEFKKNKVKTILYRDGYLNIVSKYIENKGFREAVENYIEERIPNFNQGKWELVYRKPLSISDVKEADFGLHKRLLEGGWENVYTTNYDTLLEDAASISGKQWNTIKCSQDLSFSKQKKSIIKIHGDLVNSEEKNDLFQFDNDYSIRYIISKEDYINYPKNHEAFTQLMRISLLQGTFCLFGFSGDDPNFISWIKWVRDILVRDNATNINDIGQDNVKDKELDSMKIFLITVDDNMPSPEKQQFYRNHNICVVPLKHPNVKTALNLPNEDDIKKLYDSFFNYIYEKKQPEGCEVSQKRIYQQLWNKVFAINYKSNPNGTILGSKIVVNISGSILSELYRLKWKNRFVKYAFSQERILSEIAGININEELAIKIILLAFQDTYFLPQYYPEIEAKIDSFLKTEDQEELYKRLKLRNNTLRLLPMPNNVPNNDACIYEKLLQLAFSLQFASLHKEINAWNPESKSHWVQKKASMLSLFDNESAKSLLLDYIDSVPQINEKYYATQLLNLIEGIWGNYTIPVYENQNIEGLFELKDVFIEEAIKKKDIIRPYDHSNSVNISNNTKDRNKKSFRVLQFLIESGTRISFGKLTFIDYKDWYKLFKELFEIYPYPILYYSIQCNDIDVLKRMGQDYAYSDALSENVLPGILDKLLSCLNTEDTPVVLRPNILILTSELFVSVKPELWESNFMSYWNKHIVPNYANIKHYHNEYSFACRGIQYINKEEFIRRIIIDCLANSKSNIEATIDFLSYTTNHINNSETNNELKVAIDNFINQIDSPDELNIAGNIYSLLNPGNKKILESLIKDFLNKDNITERVIELSAYFAKKENPDICEAVKKAIVNYPLWDTGIESGEFNERLRLTGNEVLRLSRYYNKIRFSDNEIQDIYSRLQNKYIELVSSHIYKGNIFKFNVLLSEMHSFLVKFQSVFHNQSGYLELKKEVYSELIKQRKYENIDEAILSDTYDAVKNALDQLYYEIIDSEVVPKIDDIYLIIDRILFKKEVALINCLDFIYLYLKKYYKINDVPLQMKNKFQKILKMYRMEELMRLELEIPRAVKYLIYISDILNNWNVNSEDILYWQNLKKQKRFNLENSIED